MATTQAVFKTSKDAGEQVVVGKTYDDPTLVIVSIPATGGPFVDVNDDVADAGTEPIALAPAGWSQAAADITTAEFALLNMAEANQATGESAQIGVLIGSFVYMPAEDPTKHVYAMNGQTITGGVATYPDLAVKWPAWVSGDDIVLPDWRGRAMMATGALGITGAAGTTYSDATSVNGLQGETFTRNDGADTGTGHYRDMLARQTIRSTNSFMGSVRVNWRSQDAETRPNAVGLTLCVLAAPLSGPAGAAGAAGADGAAGEAGTSIDHISRTSGDGSMGQIDTYTAWRDAGETVNLGTFDVPIPVAPSSHEIGELWSGLIKANKPPTVVLDGESFTNTVYPELAALAATMDILNDNGDGTTTVSFDGHFPRPETNDADIGNKVADSFKSHNHIGGKSIWGAEASFGTGTSGVGNDGASNWDGTSTTKPLTSSTGGAETAPKHVGVFYGVYGA